MRHRGRSAARRLGVEGLEQRQMLSAVPPVELDLHRDLDIELVNLSLLGQPWHNEDCRATSTGMV